jgi:hypothetical protein
MCYLRSRKLGLALRDKSKLDVTIFTASVLRFSILCSYAVSLSRKTFRFEIGPIGEVLLAFSRAGSCADDANIDRP